jgi:hypothetical protein
MAQSLSHISQVCSDGHEVGAILVEDGVGGRERAPKQEGLSVAAGEEVGKLVGGGETAGMLGPEGVLRGIARGEMRDGEMEILDGFMGVGMRTGLEERRQHAFQSLGDGAAS